MVTNTLNLKVDGMTCAHCARAVEKALKGVDGVSAAEADYASGSVTIGSFVTIRTVRASGVSIRSMR